VALGHGLRLDGFLAFFFVRHHFVRYAVGGKIGHHQPPWLLTAALVAGALPWSLVLARAVVREGRAWWRAPAARAERWLALWLLVVIAFFSASRAAIVTYVCPAFVPLALLAARSWTSGPSVRLPLAWTALVVAVLAVAVVPASAFDVLLGGLLHRRWWDDAHAVRTHAGAAAAVVLGGTLVAGLVRTRGARLAVLVATLALGLVRIEPARAVFRSYAQLGAVIRARGAEADRVVVYGRLLDGLPFYARRRTAIVAWNGMEDFGVRNDGRALRWSERRLRRAWDGRRRLFLVIAPDAWRRLRPRLVRPATVLAAEHDRVLVTNAPLGERPAALAGGARPGRRRAAVHAPATS
jgi:4-amino-4-deoxy-L-arabinose transferase-like glycosyltransferase